ncbi:MAG TPA: DUF1080 domain-containing protein, partial [Vicinamibacterales bacterium]|nr:DUF1080 domain-containing protein [Vicinamibacterales bacterium]
MLALVIACATLAAPAGWTAQSGQAPLVSPCPGCGFPPEPRDDGAHAGWTQIFDGQTLAGWDGNPDVWKAQDGAITAESTAARRVGSTFIIWRAGEPGDFELKLEIKAEADIHSGVFYRGKVGPAPPRPPARGRSAAGSGARPQPPPLAVPADPRWNVIGYGLDFDYPLDNVGNVQDTTRAEPQIGWRGFIVRMDPGRRPRAIGSLGERDQMKALVKQGDWNRLHIVARGSTLTHIVNGQVMAVLIDEDTAARKASGVIALQIEQYGSGR